MKTQKKPKAVAEAIIASPNDPPADPDHRGSMRSSPSDEVPADDTKQKKTTKKKTNKKTARADRSVRPLFLFLSLSLSLCVFYDYDCDYRLRLSRCRRRLSRRLSSSVFLFVVGLLVGLFVLFVCVSCCRQGPLKKKKGDSLTEPTLALKTLGGTEW